MIVETIDIGGLGDPNNPKKPATNPNGKMTIEEKTEILQQLKTPNLPDALRKVLIDMLNNG